MRRSAGFRLGIFVSWLAALACSLPLLASAQAQTAPTEPDFVAGELLIKLRPRAAARAHEGLQRGFAASLGDADARSLDAVLAKHRAKRLRRLFSRLEDARGALRASASQRAVALRQRYAARARRARSPQAPPQLEALYVLELDASADVRAAASELATLPDVVYAEPNWIYRIDATPLPVLPLLPDDRFVTQDGVHWSQGAWGQSFLDLWGIEKVRAIEAWNDFDADQSGAFEPGETKPGEGVVVAVIDSGVDYLHPEIAANIWTNPGEIADNGVDDDGNGQIDDVRGWNFVTGTNDTMDGHGHGTHVAGTIAGVADNGAGVVGVAPWARIMPVAGFSASGSATATSLADSVFYAAENGADILSNSWGGPGSGAISDAFAFADSVGAISVASAGNSSIDVQGQAPANLPNVIAVAALEPDDRKAGFSNFGVGIYIAAPGAGVLSLNARGGNNKIATDHPEYVIETDYMRLNGTSMACPHVSGALAVLMSHYPAESADELSGRLRAGARDVDAANPIYAGLLGSGALDLQASLEASPAPLVELVDSSPRDLPIGGGPVSVVVHLENFWADAEGVAATLSSSDPNVTIDDGFASFGNIATGETSTNESNPFELSVSPDIPLGTVVELTLSVEATGYTQVLPLRLKVALFEDVTVGSGLPAYEFLPFHVLFDDYDGDQLPDITMIGFFTYQFFKNLGNGLFANAVPETGVLPINGAKETLFFDADNDGDRDIAIGSINSNLPSSSYFENPGSVPFLNRSVASGISSKQFESLIAVDYDRDGWLDVLGGQRLLVLLRNNGNGTFADFTAAANFRTTPQTLFMTKDLLAFDYDNDGDQDVAGITYNGGFFLLRNLGNGTFAGVVPESVGIDNSLKRGAALAAGDYDNDGNLDLFLTGLGISGHTDRNALYRNEGNGSFTNVTAQSGDLSLGDAVGWAGTAFFDYDNDADLDLFLDSAGTPSEVHYYLLYRNDGAGRFTIVNESAFPSGFSPGGGTGAIADYDGDGSLDLYLPDGNFGGFGSGGLLRNRIGPENHSIRIDLEGRPREPYGARVRVLSGGVSQMREVHTSRVQSLPLHFGLGDSTTVARIEIRWPDGRLQRIAHVAADQVFKVVEQGVFCTGSADADADGVLDTCDNCPAVANASQTDTDADGSGDVCNDAWDSDGDEWSNALDVCPWLSNSGQEDANGDGLGDACPAEAVPALPPAVWLVILAGIAMAGVRKLRAV